MRVETGKARVSFDCLRGAQSSKSMLVTKAVLTRWLRASIILYHKLAAWAEAAFDAIKPNSSVC